MSLKRYFAGRRRLPEHMLRQYTSYRTFVQDKRAALRAATRHLDDLRNGCAFLPPGVARAVMEADIALKRVQQALRGER